MQLYPDLEGKVVVVTGGGSGMGRDVCLALGQAGARVVLSNRNQVEGRAVVDQIRAQGGLALFQHRGDDLMYAGGVPMARIGVPREVSNAVLWLLSAQSSYVTGATLSIDGGMSAT